MPILGSDPHASLYFEDDWLGTPWKVPETVILVHGAAESSRAWYGWIPRLASSYRVIRPDLRGHGKTPIPREEHRWSTTGLADDLRGLMDALDLDAAHIVGAKIGGTIALEFAARYPARARTITALTAPVRSVIGERPTELTRFASQIETMGVPLWAASSQRDRLGADVTDHQVDWWNGLMGQTDPHVLYKLTAAVASLDVSSLLPRIRVPTLLVTVDKSSLPAVSVEETLRARDLIPGSEMVVMPGNGRHVAASHPDLCSRQVLTFLQEHPL